MLVVAKEMASFLFLVALFGSRYCLVIFPGASTHQWLFVGIDLLDEALLGIQFFEEPKKRRGRAQGHSANWGLGVISSALTDFFHPSRSARS